MSEHAMFSEACAGLFVIRKPVFDTEQLVWGHELDAGASVEGESPSAPVSSCVAGDGLEMTLGDGGEGRSIFIELNEDRLFQKEFLHLPRERTVFAICHKLNESPETLDRVQLFKDLGFGVCVCMAPGVRPKQAFLDQADMIRVRIAGLGPKEIMALVREAKPLGLPMFATGVDEWQTFEGTRALGFTLFQGKFFSLPKIVQGKKLSASSIARIQLMQEFMHPECELNKVAEIIAQDSMLSYKLLKFINSASFSLVQKVSSIQQAVAFLGLNQLKQWASFMIMAEMDKSPKGEELSYTGLQRARFMSRCVAQVSGAPDAESMFMAGLFSRLDAMLGLPMREVLGGMPIDERLADGLLGRPGTVRDWLALADVVERGDWPAARTQLASLGLEPRIAAVEYLRASAWAGEHFKDHRSLD